MYISFHVNLAFQTNNRIILHYCELHVKMNKIEFPLPVKTGKLPR